MLRGAESCGSRASNSAAIATDRTKRDCSTRTCIASLATQVYNFIVENLRDRIATNLRKGVLEFAVLALLAQRDMYGLELADELQRRDMIASEGSLYPLLARMREGGTVEPRSEVSAEGRPRRYYTLTPRGAGQIQAFGAVWITFAAGVDALVEGTQ